MILTEKQKNSLIKRILDNSIPEPNTGCWLWIKSEKYAGYGAIGIGRVKVDDEGLPKKEMINEESYYMIEEVIDIPKARIV